MNKRVEEVDCFEPNRTLVDLTHVKFIHAGNAWSLVNANGVEIACGIGLDVCLNPDAETIKDDKQEQRDQEIRQQFKGAPAFLMDLCLIVFDERFQPRDRLQRIASRIRGHAQVDPREVEMRKMESKEAAELQTILVDKFMGNRPEYPYGLFKWAENTIKMLTGE